jgi:hypothetical protein
MNWQSFWAHPLWDYFDKVGIAAALIAMCFSIAIWLNQKRKHRDDHNLIQIRLVVRESGMVVTLNGKIRRKNLTRAEVLGLLGMLPMKAGGKPRYSLDGLSQSVFFDELEEAQIKSSVLDVVIPCTQLEYEQFDQDKIHEVCTIQPGERA